MLYNPRPNRPPPQTNGNDTKPEHDFERTSTFWILFTINDFINVFSILLNLVVLLAGVTDQKKRFQSSFYTTMFVFMAMISVTLTLNLCFTIPLEAFDIFIDQLATLSTITAIFASFYGVVLNVILALDRFAGFIFQLFAAKFFRRTTVSIMIAVSSVLTVGFSIWIFIAAGASRKKHPHTGFVHDAVEFRNVVAVANSVFYSIPVLCSILYLWIYFHLKKQRKDAISGTTRNMINRAEQSTLYQGTFLIIVYVVILVTDTIIPLLPDKGTLQRGTLSVQIFISYAPPLALPLSVIIYSNEMRRCCKAFLHISDGQVMSMMDRSMRVTASMNLQHRLSRVD